MKNFIFINFISLILLNGCSNKQTDIKNIKMINKDEIIYNIKNNRDNILQKYKKTISLKKFLIKENIIKNYKLSSNKLHTIIIARNNENTKYKN